MLTDITEVAELREAVARQAESRKPRRDVGRARARVQERAGDAPRLRAALAERHTRRATRAPRPPRRCSQEVRGLSEMVTSFLNFARPKPLDFGDVVASRAARALAPRTSARLLRRAARVASNRGRVPRSPRRRDDAPTARSSTSSEMRLRRYTTRRTTDVSTSAARARRMRRVARGSGCEVEDTGGGIAEEDLQRIFIPFFTHQVQGSRRRPRPRTPRRHRPRRHALRLQLPERRRALHATTAGLKTEPRAVASGSVLRGKGSLHNTDPLATARGSV